jgi:hypothetical protein
LKINRAVEECGYNFIKGSSFKYEENKYYHNTNYNNTFEYVKENQRITIYYQPVIYTNRIGRDRPNGIGLFRNTTTSIKEPTVLAILDDTPASQGSFYTPDYVLKISNGSKTNYYILDAKHSTVNNIEAYALPYLTFKYLCSISTYPNGKSVDGMCILCGKESIDISKNIYNVAQDMNIKLSTSAMFFQITGNDVNNNYHLVEYIKSIERKLMTDI